MMGLLQHKHRFSISSPLDDMENLRKKSKRKVRAEGDPAKMKIGQ
jgi:hypothetical protein